MDALDEMIKRLCDIEIKRREKIRRGRCNKTCVACGDGRLVAQGDSYTAGQARKYDLCQRCYNDKATRTARREELGLGAWRRAL